MEEGAALSDLTEEDCDEIFYKSQLSMIELVFPQKGEKTALPLYEGCTNLEEKLEAMSQIRDIIK